MPDDVATVNADSHSGGDAQTAGQGGTTQQADTAPPAGDKALTQADVDRIVQERLARERGKLEREAGKSVAELQARLTEYEQAEKARAEAELSEVEKAQKAAAEAVARADAAEAARLAAETSALRATLIATEIASLPRAYKALVTGDTEDAIRESIIAAKAEYEADHPAAEPAPPANVGSTAQTGAGAQKPPAEYDPKSNNTLEAWKKERERRGYPSR
jgi:hypothetical protein